jgi:hypothetical protein
MLWKDGFHYHWTRLLKNTSLSVKQTRSRILEIAFIITKSLNGIERVGLQADTATAASNQTDRCQSQSLLEHAHRLCLLWRFAKLKDHRKQVFGLLSLERGMQAGHHGVPCRSGIR